MNRISPKTFSYIKGILIVFIIIFPLAIYQQTIVVGHISFKTILIPLLVIFIVGSLLGTIFWMSNDIKSQKEIYKAIADYVIEFSYVSDLDHNYIYVSPASEAVTGYTREEFFSNRNLMESIIHKDFREEYLNLINTILIKNSLGIIELKINHKNGQKIWIRFHAGPVHDLKGNAKYIRSTSIDITDHKKNELEIRKLADYDTLTGLPNRRFIQNSIENIISKSKTEDCVFYVLFLDLDRFKSVNDTHGHSIGDQLLISLSLKMKEITHQLQAMIGRFGGDEFIIILPSCSTKDEAETAAKQIHLVTSEPFEQNGLRFILGSSIGISKFPEDGEDSETLIKHADTAMYQAKKKGHDINFYSEDIGLTTTASFQLESLLKQAIMDHKIEVHYQPIMDLHTGKVLSVESLARWNLNDQQEILPSIFIKIAEDIGKIDELDKFIASESIKQLSEWKKQGFLINISLNVSAKRFQQSSFFSETMEMLTQHQLKPENLQFEITESALLEDLSQSIEKINLMKQYNFNFAIDDFGTGFSSLNYLISLPVNHIKLDRSFITPLTKGSKLMALVDGIITIATNLDMNIIPEGIETEEQYQLLKQMGLTKGQGYYFSKPLNSQKMTAFLKNNL